MAQNVFGNSRIVRKFTFGFFSLFVFVVLTTFFIPKTYAACSLDLSPKSIDPTQNTTLTITASKDGCFQTNTPHYVFIYPKKDESRTQSWITPLELYPANHPGLKSSDGKTIVVPIDIASKPALIDRIRQDKDSQWFMRVCAERGYIHCQPGDEPNLLQVFPFTISFPPTTVPTPTATPFGFPIIQPPKQCVYQRGSSITFRIENLDPKEKYEWWWGGDWTKREVNLTFSQGSIDNFPIDGEQTNFVGPKRFCIDPVGGAPGSEPCGPQYSNSIEFHFTVEKPQGDVSCDGRKPALTPTPPPQVPPCNKWVDDQGNIIASDSPKLTNGTLKTCKEFNTAVGVIATDPVELIKRIFTLILGLSGGIALILIIFSGYRIMTSQGNEEKLQGAKETLTSAITGFLFIIFSVVILEVIGVDILGIPGLGK